jgi:putative transposase
VAAENSKSEVNARVLRVGAVALRACSFTSALFSWLACRFRSRADLELEVIALRHQLAVLRRQRPGRTRISSIDRLLWVWLYRLWPRCLDVIVVVKPAGVNSMAPARPSALLALAVNCEVRDLSRQSNANPLGGAPRIHGELPKLGIEISQATVGKYMV